jgi:uncharacterized membrane protein
MLSPPFLLAQLFWNPALPVVAVLLLAALFAGATLWARRGLVARFGLRRVWPILAARSLLFLLLFMALLDPMLRRDVSQPEARSVLVLQDVSASMDVRDESAGTRAERARRLIDRVRADAPPGVSIKTRLFDTALFPDGAIRKPGAISAGTDVGGVLTEVATRLETPDTAAIVLVTDGGDEPIQAARLPAAPLVVLGVGNDLSRAPDVSLAQVDAPEAVEKEASFNISADLAATGPAAFRKELGQVGVRLLRLQDAAWVPVDRRSADLRNGRCRVSFTTACPEPGTAQFRLAADPAAGEVTALNNQRTMRVEVRRKTLDVLYFSRRLGADLKMLRQELGADPAITFTALYRSTGERYTVQSPPEGAAAIGEAELAKGFPTDLEQLRRFDCLIFGSFPSHEWSAAEMKAVLQFVEQGGGVILLGGDDSFDGGGYHLTPLQPLMPWRCAGTGSSLQRATCLVSVPPSAGQHPAVAGLRELLDSGGSNRAPAALVVTSINVPGDPLPGAEVLLEAATGGRKTPLALEHRYGKGRVMAMASNTSWLWAREPGSSALFYRRFWRQAVRSVCGQVEGGRVLQISWNKMSFRPGERIAGTVRTPGATDVRLRATVTGAEGMRPLTLAGPENGAWQVEWLLESRGLWTLQITAERGGETLETYRKTLTVAPLPDEGSRLARQDADLLRLTARSHGAYVPEEQSGTLGAQLASFLRPVSRVENRSLVSDGPWFLLLAVMTVLAELALRRRLNLL